MTTRFLLPLAFFTSMLSAQSNFKYKTFRDSLFKVGDKIIAPVIIYQMSGGSYNYPPFKDSVEKIANFLKTNPRLKIELGGHTDSRGKKDPDLKLSKQRMIYIKDYLVHNSGIDSLRIKAKGYGSSVPLLADELNSGKTNEEIEAFHQKNRRTEIKILAVD